MRAMSRIVRAARAFTPLITAAGMVVGGSLAVPAARAQEGGEESAAALPTPAEPTAPGQGQLAPPTEFVAEDRPNDNGGAIRLRWKLSPDDAAGDAAASGEPTATSPVTAYMIERAEAAGGPYDLQHRVSRDALGQPNDEGKVEFDIADGVLYGVPYYYRIWAVGPGASSSAVVAPESAAGMRNWFDFERTGLAVVTLLVGGAVVTFIMLARAGVPIHIRRIAGLEAVDEAVGRATEMGRPVLFIPGIQDMNEIMTLAGLTALSRVAKTAAEYDAKLEVPTSRSLVMTAARETVHNAFLAAGRPDAYNENLIYYVTDEQFGYVAYLTGHMVREKPAACFYLGAFYAESLILAETGNAIGAIQIAGTAETAQLPFFVAACDYTLIGEEFYAASAYLSGEPDQLGSLRGQDVGKILVALGIAIGCVIATVAALTAGDTPFDAALQYLFDKVLR